ncbi:MAG: signal peptide peptidase SppA [Alphaproteobacteria bacterium]
MSLDADALIDRKRLKRRLGWWRVLAIIAVVAAVIASIDPFDTPWKKRHNARLAVSGNNSEDLDRNAALEKIAEDDNVKALILHINSPGGTVVGGEVLYRNLRLVAGKKPVVVVMGTLAASGGYMAALGGDHILAQNGTITGSIGVILQTTDITGLLDKIGISAEAIKSGPLKAVPSPLEPLTDKVRAEILKVVLDMHDMFVDLVAERRDMSRAEALGFADGRIFTGRQAQANRLIDAIGGENEALAWLEETHKISKTLPVRDVRIKRERRKWLDWLTEMTGKTLFSERLTLDGLVSLWHPNGN